MNPTSADPQFNASSTEIALDYTHNFVLDRRSLRPAHPRVSVVVPAKDEAANIAEVLPYLEMFYEVIVVVSEDDEQSAQAARTALPSAKVVYQTRKGKGNALVCGFARVTGDVIVTLDVDGSADPNEIPNFVKVLAKGADLAKGSRFSAGGGSQDITPFRSLGNFGLNLLASALTGTRFSDLCYGFNAFWADQLPMLDLPDSDPESGSQQMVVGDGFEIEAMIIGRFALSKAIVIEVPSYEHHRYHGMTNLNAIRDGFRVLWTILQDRFYARHYRAIAKRGGASHSPLRRPGWMRAQPHINPDAVPDFSAEVQRTLDNAWAEYGEVPEATRADIAIAAAEVGNNIVEHAIRDRDLRIRMEIQVLSNEVRVEFTDDGSPAKLNLASIRMPDAMAESGRGLALAKAFLSDLSYHRDDIGNHWTLVSQPFG